MTVTIRSAVLGDVPALLVLEKQAISAAHWTDEQYRRRVEDGVILVGEEEGRPSGFVCARAVAGEWEIENIVVAAEQRRRGVGAALLREILLRVREEAGTAVWLEVRESNEAARRIYEKRGFRESGRRRGYYQNPVEDAVVYRFHPA